MVHCFQLHILPLLRLSNTKNAILQTVGALFEGVGFRNFPVPHSKNKGPED